jgi:hypothetical protein
VGLETRAAACVGGGRRRGRARDVMWEGRLSGIRRLFILLFGSLGSVFAGLAVLLVLLAFLEGGFDELEGQDLVGELLVDERESAELGLGLDAVLLAKVDLVDLSAIGFDAQPAADDLEWVDLNISDPFTMSSK